MNELKMGGMKSYARDAAVVGFGGMVLSVADDRMADGGELHTDLVLQSGDEGDPDERSGAQTAFDRIAKFSAGGFMSRGGGQALEHSLASKVVDERSLFGGEMSANDCEVLPHGSVGEELLDECVAIGVGFGKEQDAGRKAIDAMDDEGTLLFRFQFGGKQRPCGRGVGAFDGDGGKSGGLVDGDYGIVFVEHGEVAGGAWSSAILISGMVAALA
jgi:hypothetical protein